MARARYKGHGTINGQGDYGFMITVIDGQRSGGADRFRIRIWDRQSDTIVYDNHPSAPEDEDPTTEIGGGSIIIHVL